MLKNRDTENLPTTQRVVFYGFTAIFCHIFYSYLNSFTILRWIHWYVFEQKAKELNNLTSYTILGTLKVTSFYSENTCS